MNNYYGNWYFVLAKRCASLIAAAVILTSCAPSAKMIAEKHNFTSAPIKGDKFLIQTYQKISNPNLPYVVYIEGDGAAFKHKHVSSDPTPAHPTAFSLAALDSRPNVVYVARPCQYLLRENAGVCNNSYWNKKRMSEDSVAAINEVIQKITHNQPIDLVGFSGGGGIAVLVAARNSHVKSIITVAGNLDHIAFNNHSHLPHMTESLNPIDYATKINSIPQLHLSGADDNRVPPFISEKFVKASNSSCVRNKVIAKVTHWSGWEDVWIEALSKEPIYSAAGS